MDKTMDNILMYILNDDTQNYPFCRLQIMLETLRPSTYYNTITVPKILGQRIRNHYHKTLGTSVIYSTMSPPSLPG